MAEVPGGSNRPGKENEKEVNTLGATGGQSCDTCKRQPERVRHNTKQTITMTDTNINTLVDSTGNAICQGRVYHITHSQGKCTMRVEHVFGDSFSGVFTVGHQDLSDDLFSDNDLLKIKHAECSGIYPVPMFENPDHRCASQTLCPESFVYLASTGTILVDELYTMDLPMAKKVEDKIHELILHMETDPDESSYDHHEGRIAQGHRMLSLAEVRPLENGNLAIGSAYEVTRDEARELVMKLSEFINGVEVIKTDHDGVGNPLAYLNLTLVIYEEGGSLYRKLKKLTDQDLRYDRRIHRGIRAIDQGMKLIREKAYTPSMPIE